MRAGIALLISQQFRTNKHLFNFLFCFHFCKQHVHKRDDLLFFQADNNCPLPGSLDEASPTLEKQMSTTSEKQNSKN